MKDEKQNLDQLKKKLEIHKQLLKEAKEDSIKQSLKEDIVNLEKAIAIIEGKVEVPKRYIEKVKAWETEHGKVKPLAVLEGDEIKYIFLRVFGRAELSAAETLAMDDNGEVNPDTKAEKLISDCYLGGDIKLETILNNIEYFLPVANKVLYELVAQKKIIWTSY